MPVEYWYNEQLEKYQFKFWFKDEKTWAGITHETPEGGLEVLQKRFPKTKLYLEERKVA